MGSGEDLAQMVRDYIELSESNTKPITSQSYQYPTYLYLQVSSYSHLQLQILISVYFFPFLYVVYVGFMF